MSDWSGDYVVLDPKLSDSQRLRKERQKARDLKRSQWWMDQLNRGICAYCGEKKSRDELTMDHVVPLARGGRSTKGNIVASCRSCNQSKKLETPVERVLRGLRREESLRSAEVQDSSIDHSSSS